MHAFAKIVNCVFFRTFPNIPLNNYRPCLQIDCSNGVGAVKFRQLLTFLPANLLNVTFVNETGPLNHRCGADFVKIGRHFPDGFETAKKNTKSCSFDGDADRIVYFYGVNDGKFALLDGDKIAVLFALFLQKEMDRSSLRNTFQMGIVQTAYANGNASRFIRDNLKLPLEIVPTGVKYLHSAAKKYDIGIYFEANGHGTVVFSDKFKNAISENSENVHTRRLYLFSKLINETVGDAMADLLAIETILRYNDWEISTWDALYCDAPSCQLGVNVVDRLQIKTTWDEQECISPQGLQTEIDNIIERNACGRAFVRPSGTENVVRIYAEGKSYENARQLAENVAEIVAKFC